MNSPLQSSWERDDRRNREIYSELVARYGDDVRSLDWGGRESQQLRFAVLAAVAPLQGSSVLDVGCGLGDLLGFLQSAGTKVAYTGLDITDEMIAAARAKHPGAEFKVAELLSFPGERQFDYVLESGIFTFRTADAVAYFQASIERMYALCRRAVAFNCLSAWAPQQETGEFYADPLATLDFCRTLTPRVVLRHDYHPRDFTVYLYRGGQP